jgi:hypothetical protein
MAFWNRSKTQVKAPAETHTNAPRHWPAVQMVDVDDRAMTVLAIGGQLASLHAPPASKMAFMQHFVYEDGIVEVPILVEENGAKTCIFVYPGRDQNAAAHYSGVRSLLKNRESISAVYYSATALTPTKAGDILEPIDTPMFSKADGDSGEFALWWATPEDPVFSQSPDRALLDRWFDRMNGYGYLLFTAFVNDVELVEEAQKRDLYAMPAQPFTQLLTAPGGTSVLLHASAPEGLFLAFDQSTTSARTRHVLLTLLADFATKFREAIDAKKIPAREDENGLRIWTAIRDEAIAKEAAGGTGLTLHAVSLRDGQAMRSPHARTESERASAPPAPDHEELDFAMDLVDRVVARLQKQTVEQSSEDALGQPNLFPILAARAGGHVWERQMPFEDGEEAQAAAGRVRDEWRDAEMVAVLVDAAIRENGQRTDIFAVKVERAGGASFDLIQRYKKSAAGHVELVGRPTVTPTGPFLQPPNTTGPAQPPEAALVAFAEQALDEILKMMTITEPSGIIGDDPEEPLVMPSALVNRGESRPTVMRFALQGPITAAMSCYQMLAKEGGDAVVFFIDDLVTKDGHPDRRLRLCVQRRGDPGTAIFDQHYEPPVTGTPFTRRGGLEFTRWGGSFLP